MSDPVASLVRRGAPQTRTLLTLGGARVTNSIALSIANTTDTILGFNTDILNDESLYHSTVSNNSRLTAPQPGRYLIGATVRFAANGTGTRQLELLHSGGSVLDFDTDSNPSGSAASLLHVCALYELDADEYVRLQVYQSSGGSLDIEKSGAYSPVFWAWRLS